MSQTITRMTVDEFIDLHGGNPIPASERAWEILRQPWFVHVGVNRFKLPGLAGATMGTAARKILPDGACLSVDPMWGDWLFHPPPTQEPYRTAVKILYLKLLLEMMEGDFGHLRKVELGFTRNGEMLHRYFRWQPAYGDDPGAQSSQGTVEARLLRLRELMRHRREELAALMTAYESLPEVREARHREAMTLDSPDPEPLPPITGGLHEPVHTSPIHPTTH
jgi:hypothetical protein